MTPEDVEAWIADIEAQSGDAETAHSEEDEMRHEVLRAIAEDRCTDWMGCARAALKSSDVNFPRWCA